MSKEIFSYPKEEMDSLIRDNGSIQAAIWTDNFSPSICYDFYIENIDKDLVGEEGIKEYKYTRIRVQKIDYDTIVSAIINSEYSNDQVQALISNYLLAQNSVVSISDEKCEEYETDWIKFQNLRARAKEIGLLLTT